MSGCSDSASTWSLRAEPPGGGAANRYGRTVRGVSELSLGVIAHSRKENEHRLPLHPAHLERIDPGLRQRIYLESGYGARFGIGDEQLAPLVGGIRSRERLIAECDICVLPKPAAADLAELRKGQILWGWPHCVQDEALTQVAIDRRLTLVAWEAMNHWTDAGAYRLHVFHKNNELAGYCSVLHALTLTGRSGEYGRRLRAAVISFGATGRGAVTALSALGVLDVTVLTHRELAAVASPMHSARLQHYDRDPDDGSRAVVLRDSGPQPLGPQLAGYDIVVNCILQDTDAPLMFITRNELQRFVPDSLIIDVSCDEGMGFEWARPTSFREPMLRLDSGVGYYAVDHSPSYLWDSATWEISDAVLPYLDTMMSGPDAWQADQTISRAVEIRDGVILNSKIRSFQQRAEKYPHPRR